MLANHEGERSLATDTATEATVDARSLVGGHEAPHQVPEGQAKAIVHYPHSPAPGVYSAVPLPMMRNPRRVSAMVMGLQGQMNELLMKNKNMEAVKLFEGFVNDGFKEAEQQGLPRGLLPVIRRPGEYQWGQYIAALDRSQRIATNQITTAINLMRQVGIAPRNQHYFMLLNNVRIQGHAWRAIAVIDEMTKNGLRPSMKCYEQAIFTCLIIRDLDGTSMLLDSLFRSPTLRIQDMRYAMPLYTKVILFCASLKRIQNALLFMRQMMDLQLVVPIHLQLDVAVNAAEIDETATVDSILHDLQRAHTRVYLEDSHKSVNIPIRIDEGILLAFLNCAARTGQAFLADQAWTMLKDCLMIPQNHEIRNAMGSHVVKNVSEAATETPKREDEDIEDDEDPIEEEDHDAGHEIIKTQTREEEWKETLRPLLHDTYPMVESYHAFIEAQAKAGNVERAFEAVMELEERYPDHRADLSPAQGLCMLVDELAKDANTVDQAYLVLDQWYKAGKKVTVTMLDVIVAACSRMGDANRAFETFEAYTKLGLSHRTESYNALIEVCAVQKQVEVIMKLLQEMSKAGVKPNGDTYMQIIEGYINNGDTSGISHALSITRREGFTPTLTVLDKAYQCAEKYNDDSARHLIRRELLANGMRFDLEFRGRGRGRGQFRGGFRGRGMGRGFRGRGSPYAQSNDPQYSGRGGGGPPVQTYVGQRRPIRVEPPPEQQNLQTSLPQGQTPPPPPPPPQQENPQPPQQENPSPPSPQPSPQPAGKCMVYY